jgi:amidase
MTELWRMPATELADLIRTRKVSAREASEAALQRRNAVNPQINAVVAHGHRTDLVQEKADQVDQLVARGKDPRLLAGVPVTVKINADQAGFATTNGTRLQEHVVAEADNQAVDNLRRVCAALLGRSNLPTFTLRWFTSNHVHESTRNLRDPSFTPGGSCGAAAVAAGIGLLVLGNVIGWSIRYAVYACRAHWLKPTFGRVLAYNSSSQERPIGTQLMSSTGPMRRMLEDLCVGLLAMSAPDLRDPWRVPTLIEGPPTPQYFFVRVDCKLLRISKRPCWMRGGACPMPDGLRKRSRTRRLSAMRLRCWGAGSFVTDLRRSPTQQRAMAIREHWRASWLSRAKLPTVPCGS